MDIERQAYDLNLELDFVQVKELLKYKLLCNDIFGSSQKWTVDGQSSIFGQTA